MTRWRISAQGWRRVDFASTLFHESSHAIIHHKIIKAVSVANRECERSEVIKILKDQKPLWLRGACNEGMVMWKSLRTWYPIATA
jgi:hypothetical protein